MKHFSYIVECKGKCGTRLFVRYIGEFEDDYKVPGGDFVFPLELTCSTCKRNEVYGAFDLKVGTTAQKPPYTTNVLKTADEAQGSASSSQ